MKLNFHSLKKILRIRNPSPDFSKVTAPCSRKTLPPLKPRWLAGQQAPNFSTRQILWADRNMRSLHCIKHFTHKGGSEQIRKQLITIQVFPWFQQQSSTRHSHLKRWTQLGLLTKLWECCVFEEPVSKSASALFLRLNWKYLTPTKMYENT